MTSTRAKPAAAWLELALRHRQHRLDELAPTLQAAREEERVSEEGLGEAPAPSRCRACRAAACRQRAVDPARTAAPSRQPLRTAARRGRRGRADGAGDTPCGGLAAGQGGARPVRARCIPAATGRSGRRGARRGGAARSTRGRRALAAGRRCRPNRYNVIQQRNVQCRLTRSRHGRNRRLPGPCRRRTIRNAGWPNWSASSCKPTSPPRRPTRRTPRRPRRRSRVCAPTTRQAARMRLRAPNQVASAGPRTPRLLHRHQAGSPESQGDAVSALAAPTVGMPSASAASAIQLGSGERQSCRGRSAPERRGDTRPRAPARVGHGRPTLDWPACRTRRGHRRIGRVDRTPRHAMPVS